MCVCMGKESGSCALAVRVCMCVFVFECLCVYV